MGRFLNADSYASTDQGILGNNMFAYCGNNPVNYCDPSGHLWIELAAFAIGIAYCLSGCNTENTNCYVYALRLDVDSKTGETKKMSADSGDFSFNTYDKYLLTFSPERVEEDLCAMINSDAEALGYSFKRVSTIDNYTPQEGNWLIALAYCPNPSTSDYHFWRQESDGTWTHKLPTENPSNTDFSGKTIYDPFLSDKGRYSVFIGYFEIGPGVGG